MLTLQELIIQHDELGAIGQQLHARTVEMAGSKTDPKMVAATVFMRAWSHACAFSTLWRSGHLLECEIVLRCSTEAAICLANLLQRPEAFVAELHEDAARTMVGQMKMMRDQNFGSFVDEIDSQMKDVFGGSKGKGLDWKELAAKSDANELYTYHKALSGTAAHVTGISLLRAIEPTNDVVETNEASRDRIIGWMCATLLTTFICYAAIIEDRDLQTRTANLAKAMSERMGFSVEVEN